jgi:uncharacterized protein YdeI (YjbR/CyaY-like superfamily)
MICSADTAQVTRMESIIVAYLQEAMTYAEATIIPLKVLSAFDLPDELVEASDSDPEPAKAFNHLTRGRQKSYVINLNGAKKSATRVSRIERFLAHILAGKGALEW